MKTLFAMLLALATLCAATETLAAISLGGSRAKRTSSGSTSRTSSRSVSRYSTTLPRSADRYKSNSLANRFGAGSRYKADGYFNPYSQYGSRYSNRSWRNPYATQAPRLYNHRGKYLGRWSANRYDPDSTSNPYGRYGSRYSPDSINNRYGAGNPYNTRPIYVRP